MFAQFFVDPLLLPDAVDRELNAIESEFQLAKNSDSCRVQQLLFHTSGREKKDHPFGTFSWGNLNSLKVGALLFYDSTFSPICILAILFDLLFTLIRRWLIISMDTLQSNLLGNA